MTKACDLFTTDLPYVKLYHIIYKKGSKQIWVSNEYVIVINLFSMELYTCEQE